MHVALGGSARPLETERVGGLHGLLPHGQGRLRDAGRGGRAGPGGEPGGERGGELAGLAYPPLGTYPEPVEHCEVCRWSVLCQARRRADDDLSLVAGAATRLRKALKGAGVATRRGLAALELPLPEPLDGVGAGALDKAREQARIQVRGQERGPTHLRAAGRRAGGRTVTLEPDKGLTSLPPPRPGDLFFDIEGDPFALDDGVEYLFGILEPGLLGRGRRAHLPRLLGDR